MKLTKREPLLVDKWLAEGDAVSTQQFTDTTRDNLRLAKRFVLDAEATRYCGEVIREAPRIIADAQDFAIPPFHRTYIEFPFKVWFQALTGREADTDSDDRVGYLFVGNQLRVLVDSIVPRWQPVSGKRIDSRPMLYPIQYELWNPFTPEEFKEWMRRYETNHLNMDIFFWGESALKFIPGQFTTNHTFDVDPKAEAEYNKRCHHSEMGHVVHVLKDNVGRIEEPPASDWDTEGLRALRANHRFEMVLHERNKGREVEMWDILCRGSAGELRTAIAMLLFLNRTSQIRTEREEPTIHNRMYKRRPIPLLKHRVITLHVDPKPRLLKLVAGEGIRRRLHDVRGHFCHNRIARESHHEHEWIEAEEGHMSEMQWYCECGALRWWRHEHQRGHGQKGIVTAEYKVVE